MDLHRQKAYGEAIQAGEIANPSIATLLCEQGIKLPGFAQRRWGKTPESA